MKESQYQCINISMKKKHLYLVARYWVIVTSFGSMICIKSEMSKSKLNMNIYYAKIKLNLEYKNWKNKQSLWNFWNLFGIINIFLSATVRTVGQYLQRHFFLINMYLVRDIKPPIHQSTMYVFIIFVFCWFIILKATDLPKRNAWKTKKNV